MIEKAPYDSVHNARYVFYKLVFDGKCQFDEFCAEVDAVAGNRKSFAKIVSRMDAYDRSLMLPWSKFHSVHDMGCENVYEFKEDALRVYVVINFSRNEIYIALGGKKSDQKKCMARLSSLLKGFDAEKLVLWKERKS